MMHSCTNKFIKKEISSRLKNMLFGIVGRGGIIMQKETQYPKRDPISKKRPNIQKETQYLKRVPISMKNKPVCDSSVLGPASRVF